MNNFFHNHLKLDDAFDEFFHRNGAFDDNFDGNGFVHVGVNRGVEAFDVFGMDDSLVVIRPKNFLIYDLVFQPAAADDFISTLVTAIFHGVVMREFGHRDAIVAVRGIEKARPVDGVNVGK